MGYGNPTPIQAEVIPLVQSGRDVVGQAQTGTGKTAAFGIPLIEMVDTKSREIQALVLTPTRELAMQVTGELTRLGRYGGVQTVAIYGGQAMSRQLAALQQCAHIIVATPGRLMDHMERGTVHLGQLKVAVLDEADQMLDIGFAPDIAYILRRTLTPAKPSSFQQLCQVLSEGWQTAICGIPHGSSWVGTVSR